MQHKGLYDLLITPISAEVCNWMNKGFEKLSDLCVKVATHCANILNSILQRIVALAGRLVPENPLNRPKYVSWAMKAVKWAHEGYHASQLRRGPGGRSP